MKYHYLFCDDHNGFYRSFRPFTTDKKLTQEDATKFILMHNSAAMRIGGTLTDLKIVADDYGYNLTPYRCEYKNPKDRPWKCMSGEPDLDDLPHDFDDWEIINGVSGNY